MLTLPNHLEMVCEQNPCTKSLDFQIKVNYNNKENSTYNKTILLINYKYHLRRLGVNRKTQTTRNLKS